MCGLGWVRGDGEKNWVGRGLGDGGAGREVRVSDGFQVSGMEGGRCGQIGGD